MEQPRAITCPPAATAVPRLPAAAGWPGTLAASLVVVGYGNLSTLATWAPWPGPLVPMLGHPLLLVTALAWGLGPARLGWAALGLGRGGWRRGPPLGLALAALMAGIVGALIALFRTIQWTSATAYPAPTDQSALLLLGVRLLLLTAVCEEVWFRGLLQALWVRLLGPGRGVLVVAALFAAWHLVLWGWTLERVTLQPALPLALTYPAGLLALAIAGLLFGLLRERSGYLAGPIVAHWLIDAALIALTVWGWL